jgi:hypothetical protein
LPRRMVPIWVSDPIGCASPLRTACTPATNVVATAPMPGIITPSFPSAGAIALAAKRAAGLLIWVRAAADLLDSGLLDGRAFAADFLLVCFLVFAIITSANQKEFKTTYLLVSRPLLQLHLQTAQPTRTLTNVILSESLS